LPDAVTPASASPFRPSAQLAGGGGGLFGSGPAAPKPDSDTPTSQVPLEPLFESTRRSQLGQKPPKPKDELNVPSWLNED
jgi:hypothetical protein